VDFIEHVRNVRARIYEVSMHPAKSGSVVLFRLDDEQYLVHETSHSHVGLVGPRAGMSKIT
jgi:hypothetical protein